MSQRLKTLNDLTGPPCLKSASKLRFGCTGRFDGTYQRQRSATGMELAFESTLKRAQCVYPSLHPRPPFSGVWGRKGGMKWSDVPWGLVVSSTDAHAVSQWNSGDFSSRSFETSVSVSQERRANMAALLSSFEILTTGNMTTESHQLDDIAIVHNRQQNVKDI